MAGIGILPVERNLCISGKLVNPGIVACVGNVAFRDGQLRCECCQVFSAYDVWLFKVQRHRQLQVGAVFVKTFAVFVGGVCQYLVVDHRTYAYVELVDRYLVCHLYRRADCGGHICYVD